MACRRYDPGISDATITFLILGVVVLLFISNRVQVEIVAIGAALSLWATGVLPLEEVLSGFGDPAVILIASLFVVSTALDATGTTTWAGRQVLARAGDSRTRLILLLMGLVAFLTALISVNGAVAALLPMVVVVAVRTGTPASKLLMPLAFGAHAGSLLALTGSPVSVIVSEASTDAGSGSFGFFEFAGVGIPLVLGTVLIVLFAGDRLLPARTPTTLTPDLSDLARTLSEQYLQDHRVFRLSVLPGTPLIGRSIEDGGAVLDGIELIGVLVGGRGSPVRHGELAVGDIVLVRGAPERVHEVAERYGLDDAAGPIVLGDDGELIDSRRGVAEVIIPPRSAMIGQQVFPGMVTDSGDLVVLAIQRRGEDLGPREVALCAGDTLLVQGEWIALDRNVPTDPEVMVVDDPRDVRSQAVPLGPGSRRAIVILAGMVVLLATGAVPAAVAGLLAALAIVLSRVLTVEQAYRGISWTTVILVAGMFPMSAAMGQSGAAEQVANLLVGVVGDAGPTALLLGLFVVSAALGQLISNTATALIMIPIAVSAAAELGVSSRPVLMSINVAFSAALLTPVATPGNLMVMGPAGYRFGDYARLGLPLLAWYLVVSVVWVPVVWKF